MDNKITFRKFIGHLKTVITHKHWVFVYACKFGIPLRGLLHDMSKFSPIEFWESVRYFDGTKSPILGAKADKGYSLAWQHHKGRNPHHYEYWVDKLDDGGVAILMPDKYAIEMICDYLAAGRTYNGKNFTYESELGWWRMKSGTIKMHSVTQYFVDYTFQLLASGLKLNKKDLINIYDQYKDLYKK